MKTNLPDRRRFLQHGLGLVALGGTLPRFLARSAVGAEPRNDRIVVSILLTGGPDGLRSPRLSPSSVSR